MTATSDRTIETASAHRARPAVQACVACGYIDAAVRRRIFFTLVEGLGEFWFIRAMHSSGFCLRHGREVAVAGGGSALSSAHLDVLDGWLGRLLEPAGANARVGHACYLCETEAWAEGFALDLLGGEDLDYARAQLGRIEPICLGHLGRLVERLRWSRVPAVVRQLESRQLEAGRAVAAAGEAGAAAGEAERRLADAIRALAGRDPNEHVRRIPSEPGSAGMPAAGWAAGSITMAGLRAELAAGRCPACTAARAGARTYLRWLADRDLGTERFRDRAALCQDHMHDARRDAPRAAERAVASALEHWQWSTRVLIEMADPPAPAVMARVREAPGAWRSAWGRSNGTRRFTAAPMAVAAHLARPGHAVNASREIALRQRRRPCVACEAMITASGRTVDLLGALIAGPAGRREYEEVEGLCLRHVAGAGMRLDATGRETILGVARARVRRVRWELQEWIRKSSWSVRYEPSGPEGLAWQRAMVLELGEDALARDHLATEPTQPRPAA